MPEGIGYPPGDPRNDSMESDMSSPEAVMASDAQAAEATQGTISSVAPTPEKPLSVKAIQTLVSQFNDTKDAFAGEGVLPDVAWTPPSDQAKWQQPLPPQIYAPLVAVQQAVQTIAGGEFADKYKFDPGVIVDDVGLRMATVELRKMQKDKKLIKALSEPLEAMEESPEAPIPPSPSEMTAEDAALMEGMK